MLLEFDHVSKCYPGDVWANVDISFDIDAGEVFGLLGPNGAGKTTLVAQLLGVARPTSGGIRIDGVDVISRPPIARQACSYQPQTQVPVTGLTPTQAISLAGRVRGGRSSDVHQRTVELLEQLELTQWAKKAVPLSGGVARLVAFCMAAVEPGRVVVLDEPTNDVDPLRRKLLWQRVRALADAGSAVLLVTHNVLEAERCVDRLAIIDRGRVVATGTPAKLKAELKAPLRLEVTLDPHAAQPPFPDFLRHTVNVRGRIVGEVDLVDAGAAVEWATGWQAEGVFVEFALAPVSLEDVYVRRVSGSLSEEEPDAAGVG
jgi:ABC-2 type transport system ATP-binding protein